MSTAESDSGKDPHTVKSGRRLLSDAWGATDAGNHAAARGGHVKIDEFDPTETSNLINAEGG